MDSLSILCIVVGLVTIVSRGPLMFMPRATLSFYARLLLSNNARVRVFGVAIATFAMTLLFIPFGEGMLAGFLHVVGWGVAAAAILMLAGPNAFGNLLRTTFDYLENSVSDTILRVLGFLAVVAGAALIYVGVYVV